MSVPMTHTLDRIISKTMVSLMETKKSLILCTILFFFFAVMKADSFFFIWGVCAAVEMYKSINNRT
jgi:hypothetical protein